MLTCLRKLSGTGCGTQNTSGKVHLIRCPDIDTNVLIDGLEQARELETFELRPVHEQNMDGVFHALRHCTKLQKLVLLKHSSHPYDFGILEAHTELREETIELSPDTIHDSHVSMMAACKNIRLLNIRATKCALDIEVFCLLCSAMPYLREIGMQVKKFTNLSSADVAHFDQLYRLHLEDRKTAS